ncbi:winged helix DNA-binding domain-containing protein [Microbacterium sp.]|uniref:winged helix DNA-binding domain-containing protein n=1 Tax=Microbacterium sp. TaxID=51671 RepID=UPI001AC21A32|nr:winged helix DNA-binding domain-containing protein [Microbacterium sp.]MBN9189784.1 AlkZ family DNA glycosylase [Microbacterium sp.]MBN9192926.1 AlkZ family DNA glycosylase [Microbacterium sp.]
MHLDRLRAERLRSHRLSAPATDVVAAARHMLATQAQEFWGGRWALAARTRGAVALRDVDAAFDQGDLVRSWTMRGTIHVIPARDLRWVLSVTGDRQLRAAAARHRGLGLDAETLARCEAAIVGALGGGGRLTRAELFEVLSGIGIDPKNQRGVHVIYALAVTGVICQGPVVPREGGPTREQYLVLADEWLTASDAPGDPLAELFVRYIDGHGPAGAADFAWWAGLPLGMARQAAEASRDRLVEVDEGRFVAPVRPRRSAAAPDVIALPPFEEYFLSYADRSTVCAPEFLSDVGPGSNGIVRPIIVARGEVAGVWMHSTAVGRHRDDPVPALLAPDAATDAEVAAALARYAAFING